MRGSSATASRSLALSRICQNMPCSLDRFPRLAAFLAGEDFAWPALKIDTAELLALAAGENLGPLMHSRLSASAHSSAWPELIRDALAQETRAASAAELIRARELGSVLDALHDATVSAVLLKGTPLAHLVYPHPAARPRG